MAGRTQSPNLLQVVKYLIDEGFYVNIDFHSIGMAGEGLGLAADDNTLYNTTLWVGLWCVHVNMQRYRNFGLQAA